MAMEINSAYNNYASTYASEQSTKTTKSNNTTGTAGKANAAKEAVAAKQAQSTQDYLNNLRQKYSDVNITVVDFKSEKQELAYMLGSRGGNNIAISQSIIEKMAKDPAAAAKYEEVIAGIPDHAKEVKEKVEASGGDYIASGVKIDKDGKVTYWAVSSMTTEGPDTKEKMQKQLEEKRIEKKKQEKIEAKKAEEKKTQEALENKRAERKAEEKEHMELMLSKANSAEDLLFHIGEGKGQIVSSEDTAGIEAGSRLNLSV